MQDWLSVAAGRRGHAPQRKASEKAGWPGREVGTGVVTLTVCVPENKVSRYIRQNQTEQKEKINQLEILTLSIISRTSRK